MKKQAQHRLPQCLRPKKQTLSLKKQGGSQKHCKFTWKKGTAPSSTMPEAKKTKILIEKTIFNRLEAKKTNTFIEKSIFNRLDTKKTKTFIQKSISIVLKPKKQRLPLKNLFSIGLRPKKQRFSLKILFSIGLTPKNKHSHWKNKGSQKHYTFKWKKGTAPSSTMPEAKKTKIFIKILFQ